MKLETLALAFKRWGLAFMKLTPGSIQRSRWNKSSTGFVFVQVCWWSRSQCKQLWMCRWNCLRIWNWRSQDAWWRRHRCCGGQVNNETLNQDSLQYPMHLETEFSKKHLKTSSKTTLRIILVPSTMWVTIVVLSKGRNDTCKCKMT